MTTATYRVTEVACSMCSRDVKVALSALEGVDAVSVPLGQDGTSTVTVTSVHPLDSHSIATALTTAGYTLLPDKSTDGDT